MTDWNQYSCNAVDLTFDSEPEHIDPYADHDCTNLANYAVTGPVDPFKDRLIQYLEYIGDDTVRIWFDGELEVDETYIIAVSNIMGTNGDTFTSPINVTFSAFGSDPPIPVKFDKLESRDLKNPQVERDAKGSSLGTLSVDETGDLAVESNRSALRKRILRRCITQPGTFTHLPNYGLSPKSKKLIRPTELRRLQQDAEAQIAQEPGVVSVRAIVSQIPTGGVYLTLQVRDNFGDLEISTTIGAQ